MGVQNFYYQKSKVNFHELCLISKSGILILSLVLECAYSFLILLLVKSVVAIYLFCYLELDGLEFDILEKGLFSFVLFCVCGPFLNSNGMVS